MPLHPSQTVLSWFIGAISVCDIEEPKLYSISNNDLITRPLPGTSPTEINLTLLKGDLGNENAESQIVKDVLQGCNSHWPALHYLIGTAGAGKTKALFDIGRKHVSVYFDFKKGQFE